MKDFYTLVFLPDPTYLHERKIHCWLDVIIFTHVNVTLQKSDTFILWLKLIFLNLETSISTTSVSNNDNNSGRQAHFLCFSKPSANETQTIKTTILKATYDKKQFGY